MTKTCGGCSHGIDSHYGPIDDSLPPIEQAIRHKCYECDAVQRERDEAYKAEQRRRRVRSWVAAAAVGGIGLIELGRSFGEHDAAYDAGESWTKPEIAEDDSDPADNTPLLPQVSSVLT